jgi:hypothetical protein
MGGRHTVHASRGDLEQAKSGLILAVELGRHRLYVSQVHVWTHLQWRTILKSAFHAG